MVQGGRVVREKQWFSRRVQHCVLLCLSVLVQEQCSCAAEGGAARLLKVARRQDGLHARGAKPTVSASRCCIAPKTISPPPGLQRYHKGGFSIGGQAANHAGRILAALRASRQHWLAHHHHWPQCRQGGSTGWLTTTTISESASADSPPGSSQEASGEEGPMVCTTSCETNGGWQFESCEKAQPAAKRAHSVHHLLRNLLWVAA